MLKVTYIMHSSFLVETDRAYLLMDYWKGEIPALDPEKALYVFVSHGHHDHYSEKIFALEGQCKKVYYILSSDIEKTEGYWKHAGNLTFIEPYQEKEVGSCRIRTLLSTDEGVAFLIDTSGLSIYHAGDLHWWDWPGDPDSINAMHARNYQAQIDRIRDEHFHLAFVVLDPRQEESGGLGLEYFMRNVNADCIFPMHLWEDYDLIRRFKREHGNEEGTERIEEITGPGYCRTVSSSF